MQDEIQRTGWMPMTPGRRPLGRHKDLGGERGANWRLAPGQTFCLSLEEEAVHRYRK
jgi:hypothetical protein